MVEQVVKNPGTLWLILRQIKWYYLIQMSYKYFSGIGCSEQHIYENTSQETCLFLLTVFFNTVKNRVIQQILIYLPPRTNKFQPSVIYASDIQLSS